MSIHFCEISCSNSLRNFKHFSVKKIPRVISNIIASFFRENSQQKSPVQVRTKSRRCIQTFKPSCISLLAQKNRGKTGVRSLSRRGHPRHALKNSSNNSVRTDILRRVAPGQHSAVPSGSLSRHSAGCVRLKDVRCRLKK